MYRKINSVKDLELAKGKIFKWNYVIFAAKIWTRKSFISSSKIFMYLLWPCRVLVLNFLLRYWKEVVFFVVQVLLVLTLQVTLTLFQNAISSILIKLLWHEVLENLFHITGWRNGIWGNTPFCISSDSWFIDVS